MNISLPAPMRDYVTDQVASGVCSNSGDVIRDRMWTPEALLAEFEAGEASPESQISAREAFAAFRSK